MTTIVIGAGPGLGSALARRFACDGRKVAVVSRNARTTQELVSESRAQGTEIRAFVADAGVPGDLRTVHEGILEWGGPPSALIYNAASFNEATAATLNAEEMRRDMEINLIGAIEAVQAVLPGMIGRGSGSILLTGGGLALNPVAAWASLAAGKAALRTYAYTLHESVSAQGIRVATVTICGIIQPGGLFDPARIAETYWDLHCGAIAGPELVYRPEGADPDYNRG